jgi:putative oxidoreductase
MNGRDRLARLTRADGPPAIIAIRLAVGLVFLSEGIQKWIRADSVGAGRFAAIGIPWPELMGPFVGSVEIACGALLVVGLLTRVAAVPLLGVMIVAIASTKVPILLGRGYWIFAAPRGELAGFWDMAHESRTDFAMLLGCVFLVIVGAGPLSFDARLATRASR